MLRRVVGSGAVRLLEAVRSLLFEQSADAGFVRQWEPIAGLQAGVGVHLCASQRGRGIAGNLIPLQEKNPLLLLLEFGRVNPGYVSGERKAHGHLAPLGFCSLEDCFDLENGFMPVRAVFGDGITRGGGFGDGPAVDIRNAADDNQVRRRHAVLEILIADLLLHLAEGGFAGTDFLGRSSPAQVGVMPQFLDGHAGTKDPAFRVERCLSALLEGGWVLHLDGDVVALLQRDSRRLFQDGVHANDYRLRRLGTPTKETAPSRLTVPEKMMLDCLARAAWLFCPCGNATTVGASKAVERTPARKFNEEFMSASPSSASWRERASRNHGHSKIERVDRNRHGAARAIREGLCSEIRRALVGYALREIRELWRVVGAKNAAELVPDGKQIVVVPQVRQELLHRGVRRDIRENEVLSRREAIVRLHYMCNPAAGRKLLVEKSDDAIISHCQRDVRGVADRRLGQVRLGPGHTAVGGAAHMERIDVALASMVGPTDVQRGTVIGIDGDGKRGTDSFLTQRGPIGPRNRCALDDKAARKFIGWVSERLERIEASASGIVAHDHHVAGGGCTVKFAPAEKGHVDGIVWSDGGTNRGPILSS